MTLIVVWNSRGAWKIHQNVITGGEEEFGIRVGMGVRGGGLENSFKFNRPF